MAKGTSQLNAQGAGAAGGGGDAAFGERAAEDRHLAAIPPVLPQSPRIGEAVVESGGEGGIRFGQRGALGEG